VSLKHIKAKLETDTSDGGLYVPELPGRVSLRRLLTEEREDHRKQKCSKRELLQKIRGKR